MGTRARWLLIAPIALALAAPAGAQGQAPPPVTVIIDDVQSDHLWTGEAAYAEGRATLPDGSPAAGRVLAIEARPAGSTAGFRETERVEVPAGGEFRVAFKPRRNLDVRLRPVDGGDPSGVFRLHSFHRALRGSLKRLSSSRERITEISAVPPGYKLARAWLYFCPPKAKVCRYIARGRATIKGQQMRASATFTVPKRYRGKAWQVLFRYAPRKGWGDSTAAERSRPRRTIANVDQSGE